MLRGVNVGGHNRIKMDALRALYEGLRLRDVESYVQSGNVVFASAESDLPRLAARIETRIERDFGFRPAVVLRTAEEMQAVVDTSPFLKRKNIDGSKLLVTFLAQEPEPAARAKALLMRSDPEELHIGVRELYTYFPNGMARPKLSMAQVERALKVPATGRNWNTVMELLAMAQRL
jgi:uncharacterized protein (DUF1697 family)